ncbi:MAG: isoleucine--tRNA ligase [Ignisphaera sp.]
MKNRYDPIAVEKWVLKFWKEYKIYEKVKKERCSDNNQLFRFLEGPPTANGFMHVGHARGRTFKDVMLRFMRMKGNCVWDQAGWDTQGLPVELEVERNLKFRTKKDIEVYGVEKFIQECQKLVDYYIDHWRRASERLGLWLDYDVAYETRHPKYIEVVWRFLKTAWDKGYLYEDFRVVPLCPRCETALSTHEIAQGYEVVEDPSLYFKIPLANEPNTFLIAWTTTPWTIIDNEAVAVHPSEMYVKIQVGNEFWLLAEKRLHNLVSEVGLKDYKVVDVFPGSDLINMRYIHPLLEEVPVHREHENSNHRVLGAEWVSMEEGTGVVHIAPAHGPEDFELAKQYGLIVFNSIQKNGVFGDQGGKYRGLWFKQADKVVVEDLKSKNLLAHIGVYQHEYPHCWRCGTPLMFYADKQWFIKVDPIKQPMYEENEKVVWRPDWAGKRFSDWIANARDWCISRERFWGTPLPIWTCSSCEHRVIVDSVEEIRKLSKTSEIPVDFHRPWIDKVVLKCPKCGGDMYREPYVVDVWMDSGVAHTASLVQINTEHLFNKLFPYDWITEAVDQTRGWFYTLLFTSAVMHGCSPFKSVLCQGHVLDKYGKKMSKSKGNVIYALDFMEKNGADTLRLYLLSKAAPWDSVNFDPDEIRDIKRVLDILWNCVNFAITYMDLDKWHAENLDKDLEHLKAEDLWMLYETQQMLDRVSKYVLSGDLHLAARDVMNFIVESLSHRYITLVRPRVWLEEDAPEKRAAYATLYLAISTIIKVLAPFAPFSSEYLYQGFIKRYTPEESVKESVHLELWPNLPRYLLREDLWRAASLTFKMAEEILALRNIHGIKRRWPLKKAVVVTSGEYKELFKEVSEILKVYANVKSVEVMDKTDELSMANPVEVDLKDIKGYVDIILDEEIVMEGLARDIVRRVQMLRKEKNLPVDYVMKRLMIYAEDSAVVKAVERYSSYIARETRVDRVELVKAKPENSIEHNIEDHKVYIAVEL